MIKKLDVFLILFRILLYVNKNYTNFHLVTCHKASSSVILSYIQPDDNCLLVWNFIISNSYICMGRLGGYQQFILQETDKWQDLSKWLHVMKDSHCRCFYRREGLMPCLEWSYCASVLQMNYYFSLLIHYPKRTCLWKVFCFGPMWGSIQLKPQASTYVSGLGQGSCPLNLSSVRCGCRLFRIYLPVCKHYSN